MTYKECRPILDTEYLSKEELRDVAELYMKLYSSLYDYDTTLRNRIVNLLDDYPNLLVYIVPGLTELIDENGKFKDNSYIVSMKLIREHLKVGLKTAKKLCDYWMEHIKEANGEYIV